MADEQRSIFARITGALIGAKVSPSNSPIGQTRSTLRREMWLRGSDISDEGVRPVMTDPYKQSVAVFRCINIVANSVADLDLQVKGGAGAAKVRRLLTKPNSLMGKRELVNTIVVHLLRYGNAYILKERDALGSVVELKPLPPARVVARRGADLYDVLAWQLVDNEKVTKVYETEDIIHLIYAVNPDDPIVGVSPLSVADIVLQTDFSAAVYNKTMLGSGGMPPGLLVYKGPGRLTEEMKDEVRQNWARAYGGPRNTHKMAILNSEWSYQSIGSSVKEMQYGAGRRWNLADVARVFDVPLSLLNDNEGSSVSSDAGARLVRKLFYEINIIPFSKKIAESLSRSLAEDFSTAIDPLQLSFDYSGLSALYEEMATKIEAGQRLARMGFSINSVKKALNIDIEDMPWGDEFFTPVNMVPVMDIINHEVVVPSSHPTNLESLDSLDSEDLPEELRGVSWDDRSAEALALCDRITNVLRRGVGVYRSEAMRAIDRGDNQVEIRSKSIVESIVPFLVDSFMAGVRSASINIELYDKLLLQAAGFSDVRAGFLRDFLDTLNKEFDLEIRDALLSMDSGASKVMLRRQVMNPATRRMRILARTEAFAAFNYGYFTASVERDMEFGFLLANPHRGQPCECHVATPRRFTLSAGMANGQMHPGDYHDDQVNHVGCDCIFVAY